MKRLKHPDTRLSYKFIIIMDQFKAFWFSNPCMWFAGDAYDDQLNTYQDLLDHIHSHTTDPLGYILVCDQLARHVYRKEQANHIIAYFLQKAIHMANTVDAYDFSGHELCFILLPYRHSKELQHIFYTTKHMWSRIKTPDTSKTDIYIYKRFLKATYERCPTEPQLDLIQHYDPNNNQFTNTYQMPEFKDVLQYCPTNPPTNLPTSPQKHHTCTIAVEQFLSSNTANKVIISLSGGVDSMVMSHILNEHRKQLQAFDLVAVHVNYRNKKTALEEEDMLKHWCSILGIPLYVRQIGEIRRKPCMAHNMRTTYETYTRNVRYNTYKAVMQSSSCAVVLGHNKDDVFENMITNIIGKRTNSLAGMEKVGIQDNITFWRPFLDVPKASIREYAFTHSIPHLHDSTPSWAARGKIRDQVVPALNSFDTRLIPSIFQLSNALDELNIILESNVDKFIATKSTLSNTGFSCEIPYSECQTTVLFWSSVFSKIIKHHRLSHKSIVNFVQRLTLWKKDFVRHETNSFTHIALNKSTQIKICKTKHHKCKIVLCCVP